MKNDIKGWVEFEGDLFDEIDPEESNWEISPGGIEISLQKKVGRGWSQVLKENDHGEEIFNEEYVAQVHDRLKHMTTGTNLTVRYIIFHSILFCFSRSSNARRIRQTWCG